MTTIDGFGMSLGAALNVGVDHANGDAICKIDDDDDYSVDYVERAVRALAERGAGVVGQKSYFVYLADRDVTIRMYPASLPGRVGRVAGGTIVAAREVFRRVRFPDRNLGEDVAFVRAVERAGYAVHSMSPGGYLQNRSAAGNHTWQISDDELSRRAKFVGTGNRHELWCPQ